MKNTRFSESQIMAVLKKHEAGISTADLARKHGIAESTIYAWRSKYSTRVRAVAPLSADNERYRAEIDAILNTSTSQEALLTKFVQFARANGLLGSAGQMMDEEGGRPTRKKATP